MDQGKFFARILEIVRADDPGDIDEEIIRRERIAIMVYDGGASENDLDATLLHNEKNHCEGT